MWRTATLLVCAIALFSANPAAAFTGTHRALLQQSPASNATLDSQCLVSQAQFIGALVAGVQQAQVNCTNSTTCADAASQALDFTQTANGLQAVLASCGNAAANGSGAGAVSASRTLRPLRVLAMDAEYAVGLAQEYKAAAGWQVDITVKYGNSDLDSYLALRSQGGSNQPLALYDAFIFRPDRFASLAAAGVLMPLAPVLATPEGQAMKWQDFYANLRQSVATYNGTIMAVPLGVWPFMLYVRRDWMEEGQRLLGEPAAWAADSVLTHEGLLRVVEALAAKNYDYSVAPNGYTNSTFPSNRRPVCFHTAYPFFDSSDNPPITNEAFLMHLLATLTQTSGPTQGWLYDSNTGLPFVNSPAMREALRLWLRYMAVSVIAPVGPEGAASCAVIFSSMEVFKNLTSYDTYVRSQIQIPISMPGSATYYDRRTGTLQPCTPQTCSSSAQLVRDRSSLYYNMVGGSATRRSYLFGISSLAAKAYQQQVWDFVTFLSLSTYQLAYYRDLDVNAVRAPDLTNMTAYTADPEVPNWTEPEWTAFRFMCELSILDYPNWMEEDRTPLTTQSMTALHTYAQALYEQVAARTLRSRPPSRLNGTGLTSSPSPAPAAGRNLLARERYLFQTHAVTSMPDGVNATAHDDLINLTMTNMSSAMLTIINTAGGPAQFKTQLLQSLNQPTANTGTGVPTVVPPPSSTDGSLTQGQKAAVIAVPTVVVTVLLVALLGVLAHTRRTQHRSLFGNAIIAPGPGPSTSLLITDIESSTTFWEVLPSEVMDQSIAIHHSIMRSCAQEHRCYESATEGDSFLISAHSAEDAMRCALAVQKALLEAPWPPALLAQPLCTPKWANPGQLPASLRNIMGFTLGQSLLTPSPPQSGPMATHATHTAGKEGDDTHTTRTGGWLGFFRSRSLPHNNKADADISTTQVATDPLSTDDVMLRLTLETAGSMLATHNAESWQSVPLQAQLAQVILRGISASGRIQPDSLPAQRTRRRSFLDNLTGVGSSSGRRMSWVGLGGGGSAVDPGTLAGPAAGAVLVLRGLRVRMGIHTSVTSASHVTFNKAAGRTQYSGEFLTLAKYIQDAAQGGQILATAACFAQLPKEQLRAEVTLAHLGYHELKEGWAPVPVYGALTYPTMLMRLGLLGPVRSIRQTSAGFLQAPTGVATICFMSAQSVSALMSWNPEITQTALALYQNIAQQLLWKMGGYAVEVADGLVLAALGGPTSALHWATAVIEACLDAPWPAELLQQELCEELSVTAHNAHVAHGPTASGVSFTAHGTTQPGGGTLVVGLAAARGGGGKRNLSNVIEDQLADAFVSSNTGTEGSGDSSSSQEGKGVAGGMAGGVGKEAGDATGAYVASLTVDRGAGGGAGVTLPGAINKPLRLLRGLRLKCGIDVGSVSVSLNETTGLVQYKGKVMNRAARICSVAKTGQTWCSERVWQGHLDEEDHHHTHTRSLNPLNPKLSDSLRRLVKANSIPSSSDKPSSIATTISHMPNPDQVGWSTNTQRSDSVPTETITNTKTASWPDTGSSNDPSSHHTNNDNKNTNNGKPSSIATTISHMPNPDQVGGSTNTQRSDSVPTETITNTKTASWPDTGSSNDPSSHHTNNDNKNTNNGIGAVGPVDGEVEVTVISEAAAPAAPPPPLPPQAAAPAAAGNGAHVGGVLLESVAVAGDGSAGGWWGQGAGPNGEDCVLAGVPLGPFKLKGILETMHLTQVRRLVLDSN